MDYLPVQISPVYFILYPFITFIITVCFSYIPATLAALNGQILQINPIEGLSGQQRYPSVEVRNFGLDPIYSFDVTFDYNGSHKK